MARSLSQTLATLAPLSTTTAAARMVNFRHRSSPAERLSDGDFDAGSGKGSEEERIAVKKLEDAIHQIIVRKSEPDWLPFVPGASYWVPPKSKTRGLADVVGKLACSPIALMTTKDQALSLSSSCGWPSSAHFFKGASNSPVEGEGTSKRTSQSEDEEK